MDDRLARIKSDSVFDRMRCRTRSFHRGNRAETIFFVPWGSRNGYDDLFREYGRSRPEWLQSDFGGREIVKRCSFIGCAL
jgi:hypothetical protein